MAAKRQDHRATQVVAFAIVAGLAWMSQDRAVDAPELRRELAASYAFKRHALPEVGSVPHQRVRPTNPTCENISAWVSSIGAGVTVGDLDGDGAPNDVVYTDPRTEQVIVCPAPGTPARYAPFALTQGGAGVAHVGCSGALIGDYNGDGHADVLVYFLGRAPLLYLKKPGQALAASAFSVEAPAPGLDGKRWYTAACAQGDLDGDGLVDVVVGNFFPDGSETYDPQARSVQEMHNSHGWASNGGGLHVLLAREPTPDHPHRFVEASLNLPDEVLHGWVLGLVVADLDGDLLPEVFAVNDLGPDRLLHNRSKPGRLAFGLAEGEEGMATPGSFSLGRDTYHGMGCDTADLNGDAVPDIFVSNITCRWAMQESQTLWMSRPGRGLKDGVAPYRLESERWGVARTGWGWDAKFESFGNTVMPNLVQAVGFLKGDTNRWPELQSLVASNTAFLRDGRNWPRFQPGADLAGSDLDPFFVFGPDGRYHNVNRELAGFDQPMVSRGLAPADVDGDGRMDLAIANQFGTSYLYKNESKVGHWIGLRLMIPHQAGATTLLPGRPPVRGRPAFGATARVKLADGTVLTRAVDGGNGHGGHRAPELHFGLAACAKPVEVTLTWRDAGGRPARPRTFTLDADRWHTVVLGEGAP